MRFFFFSMSVHIIVNIEGCNILCGDYGIFIAPSSKFLKTNLIGRGVKVPMKKQTVYQNVSNFLN